MKVAALLLVGMLILPSVVAGSDFGVVFIVVPPATVRQNSLTTPVVAIHADEGNPGPETVYVQLRIGSSYLDTANQVLVPGENRAIPFGTQWQADSVGTVPVRCSLLVQDSAPLNDTLSKVVTVLAPLVDFFPVAIATTPPIVHLNELVIAAVTIHANDDNPETETVAVRLRIGSYYDDTTSAELDPGEFSSVAFKPWQADSQGMFQFRCSLLVQDSAPANDTLSRGVTVYPPGSDFAVQAITSPPDTVPLDSQVVPAALIHSAAESQGESVSVRMQIGAAYDDTTDAVIQPGQTLQVTFRSWQADSLGLFSVRCSLLTPDNDPTNDTCNKQVHVVEHGEPGGPPQEVWTAVYDGNGDYQPLASFVDDTGNVYVVGWAEAESTHMDILLLKIDSLGQQVWVRTYSNAVATSAARDAGGNIYIAGGTSDSTTRDRICLLKYGTNGDQEWVRTYGEAGRDYCALGHIALDDSQNVYACGVAESSSCNAVRIVRYRPNGDLAGVIGYALCGYKHLCDGEFHILDNGEVYLALDVEHPYRREDWLVVKLSPQGQVQWERIYKETGDKWEQLRWSQVDERANIYLTGFVVSATSGSTDFCTMKMDSSGNALWTREYNGPENLRDESSFLVLDRGNIYVAGWSIYREPGEEHAITLVKYDSLGNQLWVSRYGSADTSCDLGYGYGSLDPSPNFCSMDVDELGNVYLTGGGYHRDVGLFAVLLKYDSQGNRVWVKKLPEQGEVRTGAIIDFDNGGALYDIGIVAGEGRLEVYVVKYRGGQK